VAYGKAIGNTLVKDHNGDKNECHYQELEEFIVLKKPLSAKEIKQVLGRNVVFLKTMSGVPDGEQIFEQILNKIISDKRI